MKGEICFVVIAALLVLKVHSQFQNTTIDDGGVTRLTQEGLIFDKIGADIGKLLLQYNIGKGIKIVDVSVPAPSSGEEQDPISVSARPYNSIVSLITAQPIQSPKAYDRIAFSLTTNNASVDWIVEIKAKTSVVLVPVALAFATRITSGLYPNSGNPLFPRPFPAQYIIWSSMSVIVVLNIAVAMIVFCIRERKKLNPVEIKKKILRNCLVFSITLIISIIGVLITMVSGIHHITQWPVSVKCCRYFERDVSTEGLSNSLLLQEQRCNEKLQAYTCVNAEIVQYWRIDWLLYALVPGAAGGCIIFQCFIWCVFISMFKIIRLCKPVHRGRTVSKITVLVDD